MEHDEPGLRFRRIRSSLGLSQAELAASLCIGQAAVCHYENGKRKIPGCILLLLEMLYQANPDYILHGTPPLFLSSDDIASRLSRRCRLSPEDRSFLFHYALAPDAERERIRRLTDPG